MKMKTIYHVEVCLFGEQDFFFDAKGKLLDQWDKNDAQWRGEYMQPLFKQLGYQVEEAEWDDPRWKETIKQQLAELGASEEELND